MLLVHLRFALIKFVAAVVVVVVVVGVCVLLLLWLMGVFVLIYSPSTRK